MLANTISSMFDKLLSPEELQIIREDSAQMEKRGHLSAAVLDLIYEKQWLKIMEPAACGGLAWDLPRVVRLFEALAYADGNVGWCVNLGAGANLFSGYFPEETAVRIFSDKKTCCAGSGAISGTAYKKKDGFVVSGKWKYASGSAHATHFTANAYLQDEAGEPIMESGEQVFRSFIFPAAQVTVHNTWQVTGLKATSSNDFELREVFVPNAGVFSLTRPSPFASAPVFHFPFDILAIVNMAIMPVGMAFHFLELFEKLMENKIPLHSTNLLGKQKPVTESYQNCKRNLLRIRTEMYKELEKVWEPYTKKAEPIKTDLEALSYKARLAAQAARDTLYQLFPFCGMSILYTGSELNKVWRDLSVAGQHYLLSPMAGK